VRNIRGEHLLKGIIGPIETEVLETNLTVHNNPKPGTPVKVLAKRHQSKPHDYLYGDQIKRFIHAFPDPVWKHVCLTTYLTGIRDHEVLAIPRYVRYKNGAYFTSIPAQIAERIAKGETTQTLEVLGKGKKDRKVIFPLKAWLEIMIDYEKLYKVRAQKYLAKTGNKPELHLLWFNKIGKELYCKPGDQLNYEKYTSPLTSAVYRVATRGGLATEFGHSLDYYCLRSTFATNYLINVRIARQSDPKEQTPTAASFLIDTRLINALEGQMGHDHIRTTYKHYIHNVFAIDGEFLGLFPNVDHLIDM
jgi:integrase